MERGDEIRLALALLWPEQLRVRNHAVPAHLIGHEVRNARRRVRLDVEVNALLMQVFVEVGRQELLAALRVSLDHLSQSVSVEPLAAVLVAAEKVEDSSL